MCGGAPAAGLQQLRDGAPGLRLWLSLRRERIRVRRSIPARAQLPVELWELSCRSTMGKGAAGSGARNNRGP